VFGEKYPDPVRVVAIGTDAPLQSADASCAIEFCGGTHLQRTSQVGLFKILSEESVAKGVRRVTAVTGHEAVAWALEADRTLRSVSSAPKAPAGEAAGRIAAMQKEIKDLRKRPAGGGGGGMDVVAMVESPAGKVLVGSVAHGDAATMRTLCDTQRNKGAAAIFLGGADDEKVILVAMVSEELVKSSQLKAGDWVKAIASVVGGGGGGKPTLAQAGGKRPEKLPEALAAAVDFAREKLG